MRSKQEEGKQRRERAKTTTEIKERVASVIRARRRGLEEPATAAESDFPMFVHRIQDILSGLIHYCSSSDEIFGSTLAGAGGDCDIQRTASGVNEAMQSSYTNQLILLFIDVFFSK